MKVSGFDPIKPAGGAKRTSASSASGGVRFADLLALAASEEAPPPVAASDVGATAALSNLLAMQEITEEEVRRKKLMQQGRNMLDSLENLRHQLLMGQVPMHTLRDIARNIAVQKQFVSDPKLMELMADIELRAAVELAKLEMAAKANDLL